MRAGSQVRYVAAFLLACVGCGQQPGVPRFDLSGEVTLDGEPVAAGYIEFTPDRGAGNRGPGTRADIEAGRYATRQGRGSIGGPHLLTVFGYDGVPVQQGAVLNPLGSPTCHFEDIRANLPSEPGTFDIVLPPE